MKFHHGWSIPGKKSFWRPMRPSSKKVGRP